MNEYKGYYIVPLSQIIGYEIRFAGKGGSVHNSLLGSWTSLATAKKSIDDYLRRKEDTDGETVPVGGSKQIQRRTNYRRKSSNNS
jgi:hypothetical protein